VQSFGGTLEIAERLISNLVDNGIRHNHPRGRVDVRTTRKADRSIVSVANSGLIVPADEVERFFELFHRVCANGTDHSDGIGVGIRLGLSIVKAVVAAHDATLIVQPRPVGGLQIGSASGASDVATKPTSRLSCPPSRRRMSGDRPDALLGSRDGEHLRAGVGRA
jgi:K+-sensing histidine kinase KdpD